MQTASRFVFIPSVDEGSNDTRIREFLKQFGVVADEFGRKSYVGKKLWHKARLHLEDMRERRGSRSVVIVVNGDGKVAWAAVEPTEEQLLTAVYLAGDFVSAVAA
ncbi:MAG: hypothetical protein WCP17_02585 [bacterium]